MQEEGRRVLVIKHSVTAINVGVLHNVDMDF